MKLVLAKAGSGRMKERQQINAECCVRKG